MPGFSRGGLDVLPRCGLRVECGICEALSISSAHERQMPTVVKLSSEMEASVSSLNPPLTELHKPFDICERRQNALATVPRLLLAGSHSSGYHLHHHIGRHVHRLLPRLSPRPLAPDAVPAGRQGAPPVERLTHV